MPPHVKQVTSAAKTLTGGNMEEFLCSMCEKRVAGCSLSPNGCNSFCHKPHLRINTPARVYPLSEPVKHPLYVLLAELKFGRPACDQKFLDRCIAAQDIKEGVAAQTTNKPSTQCYNKTCDAALNGECDFANVLCKIRQRTAHIG